MGFSNPTMKWTLGVGTSLLQRGVDTAKRSFNSLKKSVKKSVSSINGSLSNLVAGAVFAGLATSAVDASFEVNNLSSLADVGADKFQRMAYAAKTVGMENNDLAQVLKDMNDRIGDFVETGGGPMAKFFENIAPKVGVTAEQFQKLNSDDALQLYVDSLEKAGVNQQQMTFYMEALSGESTRLLPLLQDSGAEMKKLGEEAAAAGLIMSDDVVENLKQARDILDQTKQKITVWVANWIDAFVKLKDGSTAKFEEMVFGVLAKFGWLVGSIIDMFMETDKIITATLKGGFKGVVASVALFFSDLAIDIQQKVGGAILSITQKFENVPKVGKLFKTMNDDIRKQLDSLASQEEKNNISRIKGVKDYVAAELAGMGESSNYAQQYHDFWSDLADDRKEQVKEEVAEAEKGASKLTAVEEAKARALASNIALRDKERAKIAAIVAEEERQTAELEKKRKKEEEILALKEAQKKVFDGWGDLGYSNAATLDDDQLDYVIQQFQDGKAKGDVSFFEEEKRLRSNLRRIAEWGGEDHAIDWGYRMNDLSPDRVKDILSMSTYDPNDNTAKLVDLQEINNRLLAKHLEPSLNY